jgi:signal transduction histidine kinase
VTRAFRSTAVRLAGLWAAYFLVAASLLFTFMWWSTAEYLHRETTAVILADVNAFADRYEQGGLSGLVDLLHERVSGGVLDDRGVYLLTDDQFAPLAGNLGAWPDSIDRAADGWYEGPLFVGGLQATARIAHVRLPGDFHLLVGRNVEDRLKIQHRLLQSLAWGGVLVFAFAMLGGLLLRQLILGRIEQIRMVASSIVKGDLSGRVPERGTGDEFDLLAKTMNELLQQIEQLVDGVRNLSNTIAHDLRTPLAELRMILDHILSKGGRESQEIEPAVTAVDRLMRTFNALLRLAEIDAGIRRSGFRRIDLPGLLTDTIELFQPAAEAKNIRLLGDLTPGLKAIGDPSLISQLVANLIDNALKYSPPGGDVRVELRPGAITVADNGPGIPAVDLARATDRFWRGDRSRGTPGAGLGLSLAAGIARLHDGELVLHDNAPGLRATLHWPALREIASFHPPLESAGTAAFDLASDSSHAPEKAS